MAQPPYSLAVLQLNALLCMLPLPSLPHARFPAASTTLQLNGIVAGSFAFDGKARTAYVAALRAQLPGRRISRAAGRTVCLGVSIDRAAGLSGALPCVRARSQAVPGR